MEMNARDLAASWQLFHQASGLGTPIANERQYREVLAAVDELMDELAADETSPIAGLVELLAERIQAYEAENRKQERALAAQQRQAQQQSGPEFQNQQAPVVRHSGNDWATRKALENAATSAGSITNNGGKWDRAAEAERSRVRQEEARRRAAEEERARAAAAPKPKPTAITRCYGYNCHDDQGGTYNRATGDSNLMIGPDGKQCRRIYPSQDWQCN